MKFIKLSRMLFFLISCFYGVSLLSASEVSNSQPKEKIDTLLNTMEKRLSIMHEVAKWNWNHTSPIEDPASEKMMIQNLVEKSKTLGLKQEEVEKIIKGQITAAKAVQIKDFETWVAEAVKKHLNTHDLNEQLKPQIDQVTEDFFAQLKEVLPLMKQKNFQDLFNERACIIINGEGIDSQVREAAISPILDISRTLQ